jgi:hypothetical protein
MRERSIDGKTRILIEAIDERLREAERLRTHLNDRRVLVWPDRRRGTRLPEVYVSEGDPNGDAA